MVCNLPHKTILPIYCADYTCISTYVCTYKPIQAGAAGMFSSGKNKITIRELKQTTVVSPHFCCSAVWLFGCSAVRTLEYCLIGQYSNVTDTA